ncbi:MAG: hypothetical protein Q9191_002427 [Dirinaria sp. TL-2023a]
MVSLGVSLSSLSTENVSLYYTRDALLENLPIIVFYGPSTTGNSTQNNSRIQAHIYSPAGLQSFPRLTVAPISPHYAAVHHLPIDKQGDEVYRGLAMSLLCYFSGIPKATKECTKELVARRRHNRQAPAMFDEMHAGDLAAAMVRFDEPKDILDYFISALTPKTLSCADLDLLLPPKTITRANDGGEGPDQAPLVSEDGLPLYHYGKFNAFISSFGAPAFLPTSKLKRAPSRPTIHGRTKLLNREQKVALRKEILELMDTEKSYVEKIHDLVRSTARDFRLASHGPLADCVARKLFPESLNLILENNSGFCDDIEKIVGDTEEEAINDIHETREPALQLESAISKGRAPDAIGITRVAKALLQWLPRFSNPYQDYMRASTNLSSVLNEAIQCDNALSNFVQEYGEQHLRSVLIEPVQRLPRYSLLIDNMINLLPSSHPALNNLLRAKDTVTEICALDLDGSAQGTRTVACLRNLVEQWPASLTTSSRLITAVDVREVGPPYSAETSGQSSMFLIFPEFLIVLTKVEESALSARGLIAEVERPAVRVNALATDRRRGLQFFACLPVADLRTLESENGRLIWLLATSHFGPTTSAPQQQMLAGSAYTRAYLLHSPYDGKAARLTEEICKARIEGRFPEAMRESERWSLRTISPSADGLGLLAAIFEDDFQTSEVHPNQQSRIRLEIGRGRTTRSVLAETPTTEIAICVSALENERYRLDCRTAEDVASTDVITGEQLPLFVRKRLQHMLRSLYESQTHGLAAASVAIHRQILQAVPIPSSTGGEARGRNFRPISPVKILSNFLGGGPTSQPSSPSKQRGPTSTLKDIPRMLPPVPPDTGTTFEGVPRPVDSVPTIQANVKGTRDSLSLLEDTFAAYIVALRSRSGNIIGRVLRGRATADELKVNELYNTLVEDPSRIQEAAEVPVDVLFVSFEKFVRVAWKDRMGPMLPRTLMESMQAGLDTGRPTEFVRQFRTAMEEMTPQNKRAFTATVKLLSDLLDASGNDGDRGALMASFTEVLIVDDTAHDYITLLDRLVDDYEMLFESNTLAPEEAAASIASDSLRRNRSVNTGSLSSNASSLRRKFGFGTLSRENSKSESESKVTSVWRTLSKNAKSPSEVNSQPGSLSKGTLLRSRSTDTDTRMLPPLRPGSKDRPTRSDSIPTDEPSPRPGSSHRALAVLSTIGEGTPTKPSVLTKKKRRSSLSDLKPPLDSPSLSTWMTSSPSQLRTPTKYQHTGSHIKQSPRDQTTVAESSVAKPDASPNSTKTRFGSPERLATRQMKEGSPQRFGYAQHKSSSAQITPIVPPKETANRAEQSNIASPNSVKPKTSQSAIPAPKGLSERQWPPNGTTLSKKGPQPPQKLRLQSPQKLRERLSNEHKTLNAASDELQAELAAIGTELSALKRAPSKLSHIAPIKPLNISSPKASTTSPTKPSTPPSLEVLSSRLDHLTKTITAHTSHTTSRLTGLATEASNLSSQLEASNRKVKKLDALYQEANAENEALYERFNDELRNIVGRVKKGEGVLVLKDRVAELEREVGILREEKRALKSEAVERDVN